MAALPIQLLVNDAFGKAPGRVPSTHMGNVGRVPGSWFHPDPSLTLWPFGWKISLPAIYLEDDTCSHKKSKSNQDFDLLVKCLPLGVKNKAQQ